MKPVMLILLTVFALLVLFSLFAPSMAGGGPAKGPKIFANLRRIEILKQMWAQDHSVTGAVQITEQDLAAYLHNSSQQYSNFVSPVICERYIINPLGVSPEAVLTNDWKRWPKGTVFRLNTMKIIPPNEPR